MRTPSSTQSNQSRTRQRASLACDFCHGRGLKCRQSAISGRQPSSCLTCIDYGVACTVDRPVRRRGRKPARTVLDNGINNSAHTQQSDATLGGDHNLVRHRSLDRCSKSSRKPRHNCHRRRLSRRHKVRSIRPFSRRQPN